MSETWTCDYRHLSEVLAKAADHERIVRELRDEVERLTDLVRYERHHLFDEKLISEEEFAALVADSENGQRVARLEGYDKPRQENATLRAEVARLSAPVSDEEVDKYFHMQYGSSRYVATIKEVNTMIGSRTNSARTPKP